MSIVAIHGFMFDPEDSGDTNPTPFFDEVAGITGRPVRGFAWYSVPFGLRWRRPVATMRQSLRAWLGSWRRGYLHPYRYAWALAAAAAEDLAAQLRAAPTPVVLVAHSLGARVALGALERGAADKVARLVLFNGAELVPNAQAVARTHRVAVLNLVVRSDSVLRWLGRYFSGDRDAPCIGQAGLGPRAPAHWRDVVLDDPLVQRRALARRGWTLRGDNPRGRADHWYGYRFAGNTDLVRAFLRGENIGAITGR